MPDGPNYEALFKGMKCLLGTNAEDVKHIVRWLRFFQGQEGYEMYADHYLPLLPADVAAEFKPKAKKVVIEPVVEVVVEESTEEVVSIQPPKRGRPSKK